MLALAVHVRGHTAHRVIQKAGLAGCRALIITYRELTSAQSILRNAAIPNYLMPMPFQKVTLVFDRCDVVRRP